MRQPRIIFDFLRNTDAKLEIQSNAILACMTRNPHFPNPVPSLEVLSAVMQQYSVSLAAAQHRDRILTKQKEKDRGVLETSLRGLSNYVTLMADGDRAIMASAGFTVSAATTSKSTLGETQDFSVVAGKVSGEVTISIKPMKGAEFYLFYYAVDTQPIVWMHRPSKYSSMTLTGLEPLTTYLFQIVAHGIGDVVSKTGIISSGVL